MAVVHLVGAGTVLPAVSRGDCDFRLMERHLCPSCSCCPWCSIQEVICPGALAAVADGMAGGGHRSWRSILIFFPGAPVPSLDPCPVLVKESLILALQTIPAPRGILHPGSKQCPYHLDLPTSCLLKLQSHGMHSTHWLPYN